MKKLKFLIYAFLALFTLSFAACGSDDDDDDNGGNGNNTDELVGLPTEVQRAFSNKYPDVKIDDWSMSWSMQKSYYIVNFTLDKTRAAQGVKASAWFGMDYNWKMTEADEDIDNMPAAIIEAFKASRYADWKIDDIDIVEREGMTTIYVIEVKMGKEEYELYFLEDGTLIKEVLDTDEEDEDYLPEIPVQILEYLNANFKGFVVMDAEFDDGEYEIEFEINKMEYEVKFDFNFNCISTKYEMSFEDLPQKIRQFIEEKYPGWETEEIEVCITNEGKVFIIELEKDDEEIELVFDEYGIMIS